MIGLALGFAYGCFGLAMLCCLYRVVRAPGLPDRLLALDTMTVNAIALLALFGIDRGLLEQTIFPGLELGGDPGMLA